MDLSFIIYIFLLHLAAAVFKKIKGIDEWLSGGKEKVC